MANSDIQMRMDENRHIIRQIVHAILFLRKQGLPFRGDNEDFNITKNPGNFLALLKCFSESDYILFDHLNKPRAKNATYISPRFQNEIINVIGHDIIWIYLPRKGAYRDFLYIILKHTQQATSWYNNYLHRRKGKKVMTATNMCSNFVGFVGFRYGPPLNVWRILAYP